MKNNYGFTLIELLAIVVILGVIIAVAAPNMTKQINKKEETEEELADLLEVVRAIADFKNIDVCDVEKLRISKKKKRGGFYKRIYLESTCDQNYIDENKGCLLCVNNSCKLPTSEKMHDEYGKPAGYYCVGFKNCYVKKFPEK